METTPPRVIGITGRKGSGKDHIFKVISTVCRIRFDQPAFRLGYATPIKDISAIISRVPRHIFDQDASIREIYKTDIRWDSLNPEMGKAFPKKEEFVTVRQLEQMIGTDLFRTFFCPLVWINHLQETIRRTERKVIVVADMRLPIEATTLRELGGIVVKVVDPSAPPPEDGHQTESYVDKIEPDHTVVNDRKRDPQDLEKEVMKIVFPA